MRPGELKALPQRTLRRAAGMLQLRSVETSPTLAYGLTHGTDLLPRHPIDAARAGAVARVPLIVGTNSHEASMFAWTKPPMLPTTPPLVDAYFARRDPAAKDRVLAAYPGYPRRRAVVAFGSDAMFGAPTWAFADAYSAQAPTHVYRFDHATWTLRALGLGATHGSEIVHIHHSYGSYLGRKLHPLGRHVQPSVGRRMQRAWLDFAAGADPGSRLAVTTCPGAGHPDHRHHKGSRPSTTPTPAIRERPVLSQGTVAPMGALRIEQQAALGSGADFWTTKSTGDVPAITLTDGPHGVRRQRAAADHLGLGDSEPATCFPPAVALAQTWDPDLVGRVAAAIGREAQALDVQVVLGPGVNIKRDPRCGRNFEYYSEDPHLAGVLGVAWVHGIQAEGVGASVKHFAVNNQEHDRMRVSADVDSRALREIYLRPFQRVVTRPGRGR